MQEEQWDTSDAKLVASYTVEDMPAVSATVDSGNVIGDSVGSISRADGSLEETTFRVTDDLNRLLRGPIPTFADRRHRVDHMM